MSDWRTEEKLRATLARREEEAEDLQRQLDAEREMRAEAEERAASLSGELLTARQERDSYRATADMRVGMRREFEVLLGVRDTTDPDAFEDGLIRLRALLDVAEAAEALRHKMREVYADSRYMNVWATAQGRLGPYSGPDWIAEAAALDAALAARGGE